jgi:hypothetical protein
MGNAKLLLWPDALSRPRAGCRLLSGYDTLSRRFEQAEIAPAEAIEEGLVIVAVAEERGHILEYIPSAHGRPVRAVGECFRDPYLLRMRTEGEIGCDGAGAFPAPSVIARLRGLVRGRIHGRPAGGAALARPGWPGGSAAQQGQKQHRGTQENLHGVDCKPWATAVAMKNRNRFRGTMKGLYGPDYHCHSMVAGGLLEMS